MASRLRGGRPAALTRRDLERLFGVSRARAAQLMRTFGAELAGSSRVLRRADILRQLKRLRRRGAFWIEAERRTRLVAVLRQAWLTAIRVAGPVESLQARLAGLPGGRDGRGLRDRGAVGSAQEAVGRLLAPAQALTGDYEGFKELVGKEENAG